MTHIFLVLICPPRSGFVTLLFIIQQRWLMYFCIMSTSEMNFKHMIKHLTPHAHLGTSVKVQLLTLYVFPHIVVSMCYANHTPWVYVQQHVIKIEWLSFNKQAGANIQKMLNEFYGEINNMNGAKKWFKLMLPWRKENSPHYFLFLNVLVPLKEFKCSCQVKLLVKLSIWISSDSFYAVLKTHSLLLHLSNHYTGMNEFSA